ncbi:hypothetical protein [Robertmurraya korlensis]|uniref:hypothetical protein n=1 Tax=Robertmurraya korlensis TaxID=519977 RepID=UPI00352908FD
MEIPAEHYGHKQVKFVKAYEKGDDMVKKNNEYLTNAAKQNQVTIQNGGDFPNLKNIPGDSVDEHKNQEVANQIITGDEIKQQNENL